MARKGISLAYSELNEKPELAKMAEDAGFDYIWNSGESIAVFGAMSMVTKKAHLGTGVIRAFGHDARNLAEHAVDLQQLTGGRFIMGLGGGTKRMNINQFGVEFDHPATRLRELIKLLKQVWNKEPGEPLKVEGRYYSYFGGGMRGMAGVGLGNRKKSQPPVTPIYLAAVNRAMFRLAGEWCEGLCGHPIASVPFIEKVAWPSIDEGLARAGKTRSDFDHAAWIVTAINTDRKEAMREAKYHIGRFMATRSYAIVLDSQGLEDVRLKIQDAFFKHPGDSEALIAAVPDDVAASHSIFGTKDEVRAMAKRYEGLVTTPTYYCASALMSHDRVRENLELMIETFGD